MSYLGIIFFIIVLFCILKDSEKKINNLENRIDGLEDKIYDLKEKIDGSKGKTE